MWDTWVMLRHRQCPLKVKVEFVNTAGAYSRLPHFLVPLLFRDSYMDLGQRPRGKSMCYKHFCTRMPFGAPLS